MSLFEIVGSGLTEHPPAHFADLGLYERGDLQRLVRDQIGVIGDDLLVVAEEFGEWEDARRRIDLLALDRAGHPTVIELKRTDDGGHMELQALRYAAMVSSMDFDDFVTAFVRFSARQELGDGAHAAATAARTALVEFLGGVEGDEPIISSEVRIILVSANFGRELMTTVLWLNRFEGLDIRCVQLIPYRVGERVLIDVRQLVPLPEASDYQVRVRRKEQQRERVQRDGRDFTRYHVIIDGEERPPANKRTAMRLFVTSLAERGVSVEAIKQQLHPRCLRSVEGRYHDADAVKAAFLEADPKMDIPRWWYEHPLVEDDRTWILTRMWGTDTEPSLAALANAFPQARVTYRAA